MMIYLACTIRGNRDGLATARLLCELVQRDGHDVVTTHLLSDNVEEVESALTEREVYERDINWLDCCDLLVAEASGSSYGVGFEIGYVLGRSAGTGQRVLLLFDTARRTRISRLIAGNTHPGCTVYGYANHDDLERFVTAYFRAIGDAQA
jgi:2'-deoxynucleoside 5'-phosphate N-hydrolase